MKWDRGVINKDQRQESCLKKKTKQNENYEIYQEKEEEVTRTVRLMDQIWSELERELPGISKIFLWNDKAIEKQETDIMETWRQYFTELLEEEEIMKTNKYSYEKLEQHQEVPPITTQEMEDATPILKMGMELEWTK